MKEIDARFTSNETIKAKVACALGLDQPHVFDTLRRSDFASHGEFLDAAALAEMQRTSPEFQATRRRLARQWDERQEAATRQAQNTEFKVIRSTITLNDADMRRIDEEAVTLARRDLAGGLIPASGLGEAIEKHALNLTEKRKDTLAANKLFNSILRGER